MGKTYNFVDGNGRCRAAKIGRTFVRNMTYKDDDDNPIDLTGYTAKMQIRDGVGSSVIHTFDSVTGGITLGGAAGTIVIRAEAADTDNWPEGTFGYDFELVSPTVPTPTDIDFFEGSFQIKAAYTQG